MSEKIKVLHFFDRAVLGHYPFEWVTEEFRKHGVIFQHGVPDDPEIYKDSQRLTGWANENDVDWVFLGSECQDDFMYRELFESVRRFKILVYAKEQPQRLDKLIEIRPYTDILVNSSPIYPERCDHFVTFGSRTRHFNGDLLPYEKKENKILISGSFRHSRCQLFEKLLQEQPFDWEVVLLPPCLDYEYAGGEKFQEMVSRYSDHCLPGTPPHKSYISSLLDYLNQCKLFIDFTTNASNHIRFYEDLDMIFKECLSYRGGYCPERVLDALWMKCFSFCLFDPAVLQVLGSNVDYYINYDDLVRRVNKWIADPQGLKEKAEASQKFVHPALSTENSIEQLAAIFKGNNK